jgi:hypothetical protein
VKTTVDISPALLSAAKKLAAERGTTLRALIEDGLRRAVEEAEHAEGFRLRDGSFGGRGLRPDFGAGDWDRVREAAYEGRGT